MPADPPRLSDLLEHREFLERFARSLARDPAVADDVVQETWLTALERPPKHRGDLRAWLRRVARNVFLQRHRSRTRAKPLETASIESRDSHEREPISSLLASELLALPELYRRVLILRFYEDKTPTEIARELDRPVNTVTSQIARGLKLMQERLDRSHPDGRSRWLPAVLALARGRGSVASASEGSVPIARSIGGLRAAVGLLVAAAAVALVVLVLRAPSRPSAVPEGTRVAEGDSTLVAPPTVDGRTPETLTALAPVAAEATVVPPIAHVVVQVVTADGTPIAGAGVRTARDETPPGATDVLITFDGQDRTDADGRVEIGLTDRQRVRFGPGPEELCVQVEASGFQCSDYFGAPFPEAGQTVTIETELVASARVVRGRVIDSDGAPVEAALVMIGPSTDRRIELGDGRFRLQRDLIRRTLADGTFEHAGLPPGTLNVSVERSGFLPYASQVGASEPSVITHDVILHRGVTVSGRVTTADGRPAARAALRAEFTVSGPDLGAQEAVADEEGRYEMHGVAPGAVWLLAQHGTLSAIAHLDLAQTATHVWNAVLEELPALSLRIVREDGSPMAGAMIRVHTTDKDQSEAWQRFQSADANGRVRFEPVPATDLTVAVFLTARDREHNLPPCHAQQGLHGAADEQVLTVPAARLGRGGMRGVLLDHDGEPFDEATVLVRSRPGPFFSQIPVASGTAAFETDVLTTQLYDVVVWCGASGTWPLGEIEILAHDTFDFGEIALPPRTEWSPVWPGPDAPPGDAYRLVKIDPLDDGEKRWMVSSGAAAPPPSFSLFPGKYEWLVYRSGQQLRRETFEVK